MSKIDIQALRERIIAREQSELRYKLPSEPDIIVGTEPNTVVQDELTTIGMHGESITYNKEQAEFVNLISSGESCVLIGAAGTGKTTCSRGGITELISSGKIPPLQSDGHKFLHSGAPGVIIISFTRRAVNNIRKVQSEDLKSNCITAHKLLQFQPVAYEIEDPETKKIKTTMRFEPMRNKDNPLPTSIHTIVVEEASMLSVDLFNQITDALQHKVQWVFIGDIQQLPPVFGPAILGFKMLELPVIELTQVYRQALESPIIRLAHRILSGEALPVTEFDEWKVPNKLTIHPWKKKIAADTALLTLAKFFTQAIEKDIYNVDEDVILIPYNKSCGCDELNKEIANHLARKRNATTYELVAGFEKHYLSVGDKILFDREDAEIIEIKRNPAYTGARYQPESKTLDYWGHNPNVANDKSEDQYDDDVDFLLDQVASSDERVNQCSHILIIRLYDSGSEISISTAGEVNSILLGYAITIHKAQGSEWRKVFLAFHQSHAKMMQRELLYTAVTRAREELYIICEPESLVKGIKSQRIKGDTLEEKAQHFKGKLLSLNK